MHETACSACVTSALGAIVRAMLHGARTITANALRSVVVTLDKTLTAAGAAAALLVDELEVLAERIDPDFDYDDYYGVDCSGGFIVSPALQDHLERLREQARHN